MPAGLRLLFAAGCLAAAAADTRADGPADLTRRQKGDLAIRARAVLTRYCRECHTGAAAPGQSLLPVLDHPRVVTKAAPIPFVAPGEPDRSLILQLVADGSMPPGGRPRPSAEEVAVLRAWAAAGAPSYPQSFDDRATLRTMLDDLDRQKPADVPFLRYVSLAHLVPDGGLPGAPMPDLAAAERKLSQALMAASGRPATPNPVDDTATLFRLDLRFPSALRPPDPRPAGWAARDLFKVDEAAGGWVPPRLVPFDLILLEYPFGFRLPADDPDAARLDRFLARAEQVMPVPFVRGDWLADALMKGGERSPLGEELMALDELAQGLKEKPGGRPGGPPAKPFPPTDPLVVPFPGRQGWQTPIPPLGAWYARDVVPAPAPFEFKAEAIGVDGNPLTKVAVGEPFQVRVATDRDVYVRVISVLPDGAARVQPVAGAGPDGLQVKASPEPKFLFPPGARAFVAGNMLTDRPEEDGFFVLLASDHPIPAPAYVVSKHARPEIWRFVLPEAGKDFDPTRVVRRVVPVTVVRAR
jgi:hypothetical protein